MTYEYGYWGSIICTLTLALTFHRTARFRAQHGVRSTKENNSTTRNPQVFQLQQFHTNETERRPSNAISK